MEADPDGIRRSVYPRTPSLGAFLPIIVLTDTEYLVERTGEIGSANGLADLFVREPSSIVIGQNVAETVAILDHKFGDNDLWQYRVTPMRREAYRPDRTRRPAAVIDTLVTMFGFRGELRDSGKSRKPGKWFHPLDPFTFSRTGLTNVLRGDGPKILRLLRWGQDIREFCQSQRLNITPTGGGLAGQLLRDPRFYPEPRRKVPKRTNADARHHLPGNHYGLLADTDTVYPVATYLDMASAHHNAAADLKFPHPDRLTRRGDWDTTDPTDTTVPWGRPQWEPGTTAFNSLLARGLGMFRVRLRSPEMPDTAFPLPQAKPGLHSAFVFSNEIPYMLAQGCIIEGIDAAWSSFDHDPGLNRYAAWALAETATMTPERKAWAKPVLLSVYGILAAKPKSMELGYKRSKGGREVELPAGRETLKARLRSLGVREPPVANVVHRGMIEAETRLRCLMMARKMTMLGHHVLSIYADSIIVEPNGAMPLLPPPWIVKEELSALIFHNSTSFTSNEMSRLPGIPRDGMERARRLAGRKARARAYLDRRG